jgi:hypothetical protein
MADATPSPADNDAENPYSIEQASRIYFLPNLMTAGNLFCGFAACLRCIEASFIARGAAEIAGAIPPEAISLYKDAVWYIFGARRLMRLMDASRAWEARNRCSVPSSIRWPTWCPSVWHRH